MKLAKIHKRIEPAWHIQLAILFAIAMQIALGSDFVIGPKYAIAIIEIVLLIALSLPGFSPKNHSKAVVRHLLGIGLLLLIGVSNIISLILVSRSLINGVVTDGHVLILSALAIYATNIIVFGLLYWELDGYNDQIEPDNKPDFLFPQMQTESSVTKQPNWQPTFLDYLYVSTTNATAFSPTDAMPITYRAKVLMTIQALTSLTTIALVAARAVNILH